VIESEKTTKSTNEPSAAPVPAPVMPQKKGWMPYVFEYQKMKER
jgi:hypothetical protein